MRKNIYSFIGLLAGCFLSITAYSQTAIPNGDFEDWNTITVTNPQTFTNTSNNEAFNAGISPNCFKVSDSYHGNFAVKIISEVQNKDSLFGYIVNCNPDGNPFAWHGGTPLSQKPAGIRGYYKSDFVIGDTGLIIVAFSNSGVNIGTYIFQMDGIHSSYTAFDFAFNPPLSVTPDSVVFAATSSNPFVNKVYNGSWIQYDSISFTGGITQPTQFNGDFELWKTDSLNSPQNWFVLSGNGGSQNSGVTRTTDSYKGKYAIELKTFLGNRNNQPAAQNGIISTGKWCKNCNTMMGGYPFTNTQDTLAFWYKYTPASNDSASFMVGFKNNGTNIASYGRYLSASANYKYVEFPFIMGQTPDTAYVLFQSSLWQDTLVSFVGSDLIIDGLQFKSNPLYTAIPVFSFNDNFIAYPNPATTNLTLKTGSRDNETLNLTIYNDLGMVVKSMTLLPGQRTINVSDLRVGMYNVEIKSANYSAKQKLIVK